MKKYEILKKRMNDIIIKNNIDNRSTKNYENKLRELLLNYNDDMLQKNLDLMHDKKNIENFINYMRILEKLYQNTIASILIIEKRIFNSYRYVTNSTENLSFCEINEKIYILKNANYDQYKLIRKLLWKKNKDYELFYIALELCRQVRNEIIHKDWIGLIKIEIKTNVFLNNELMNNEFRKKIDLYNIYIDQKGRINLIDCFILIDSLMEASNLSNNFNNIKEKLKKYIVIQ